VIHRRPVVLAGNLVPHVQLQVSLTVSTSKRPKSPKLVLQKDGVRLQVLPPLPVLGCVLPMEGRGRQLVSWLAKIVSFAIKYSNNATDYGDLQVYGSTVFGCPSGTFKTSENRSPDDLNDIKIKSI